MSQRSLAWCVSAIILACRRMEIHCWFFQVGYGVSREQQQASRCLRKIHLQGGLLDRDLELIHLCLSSTSRSDKACAKVRPNIAAFREILRDIAQRWKGKS